MYKKLIILLLSLFTSSCMRIHTYTKIKKEISVKPQIKHEVRIYKDNHVNGKRKPAFKFCIPHKKSEELQFLEGYCLFNRRESDHNVRKDFYLIGRKSGSRYGEFTETVLAFEVQDFTLERNDQTVKSGHYHFVFKIKINNIEHIISAKTQLSYDTQFEAGLPFIQWKM